MQNYLWGGWTYKLKCLTQKKNIWHDRLKQRGETENNIDKSTSIVENIKAVLHNVML